MPRAVDREGRRQVERLGDLGGGLDPVVPGGAVARQLDAGLLEERRVGEAAGQRQLGHEAGDRLRAVGAHPVERVGEVGAPGLGVGEIGRQVEPVVGLLLEVGDPGDVGTLSRLELDRQLLLDHLVGDVVEDDVDPRVLGHEPLQEVVDHRALDAVRVPHHPHVAGHRAGGGPGQQRGRQHRHSCHGLLALLPVIVLRPCASFFFVCVFVWLFM